MDSEFRSSFILVVKRGVVSYSLLPSHHYHCLSSVGGVNECDRVSGRKGGDSQVFYLHPPDGKLFRGSFYDVFLKGSLEGGGYSLLPH